MAKTVDPPECPESTDAIPLSPADVLVGTCPQCGIHFVTPVVPVARAAAAATIYKAHCRVCPGGRRRRGTIVRPLG